MRHGFSIDLARHSQGLALYHSGARVIDLVNKLVEIEKMHYEENVSEEKHTEIENAGPALLCGFPMDCLKTSAGSQAHASPNAE